MASEGLIFDIKRYAINDGPGIRVTFFLKGCNLRCAWCHNPEGIAAGVGKLYTASRCIGCGTCVSVCPAEALTLTADGVVTDQDKCTLCGKCAEVCPTKAFEMSGQYMSVGSVMEIIEKERIFMEQSGGGVTFSGGEPLLQPEFLLEVLTECGRRGIHRTVDTAGHIKTETLLQISGETDLFLFDLKIMDDELHREFTGVSNALILENLRILSGAGAEIIIRIPLIGGINDHETNAMASVRLLQSLPRAVREVHLLPYHAIARVKFQKLGRSGDFEEFEEPDAEAVGFYLKQFTEAGIPVQVGG
jgi:pyruvate formate lyase activating enzyme